MWFKNLEFFTTFGMPVFIDDYIDIFTSFDTIIKQSSNCFDKEIRLSIFFIPPELNRSRVADMKFILLSLSFFYSIDKVVLGKDEKLDDFLDLFLHNFPLDLANKLDCIYYNLIIFIAIFKDKIF